MRVLTPAGRALAAAGAALVAAGAVARYSELMLLGVTALVAVAAGVAAAVGRPDLSIERRLAPSRVTEGAEAFGDVTVTNRAGRRSPPLLAVEAVGDRRVGVGVPRLRPGARVTARYRLPTDRRGLHPVGPLTLARSDALRLAVTTTEHPSSSLLVVVPRVHDVAPVPAGRSRDMDGPTTSASPHGGVAFHSLREYTPGDDLRLIHWRSTARTGTLMVRHNVVPHEPRVVVVLDTHAGSYRGDAFEDAVRVAASLCVATAGRGAPVALRTTAGRSTSASTAAGTGRDALLDLLAGVEATADDRGLADPAWLGPEGESASLAVVTGHPPPDDLAALGTARARFGTVCLVRVGDAGGADARAASVEGVVTGIVAVEGRTSEDAAAAWNQRVRP
jgi:uncharacterized protein (DUF58 family)